MARSLTRCRDRFGRGRSLKDHRPEVSTSIRSTVVVKQTPATKVFNNPQLNRLCKQAGKQASKNPTKEARERARKPATYSNSWCSTPFHVQVEDELDGLLAEDCPFCGQLMIDTITKPFLDPNDEGRQSQRALECPTQDRITHELINHKQS